LQRRLLEDGVVMSGQQSRQGEAATYPFPYYVGAGGLVCCGPDSVQQYRRAASHVDRIFEGETPVNLAVQMPVKYWLTINTQDRQGPAVDSADRLRLRGPRGAQFEFTLAAVAQNLRRLSKLVARPPPAVAACVA
jgi:hypothetical protein